MGQPAVGRDPLQKLARHAGLIALDVGARGGLKDDLSLLASATDYYGFEPDKEEFARLQRLPNEGPWRSVTYVNEALAAEEGTFTLNLYSRRGCSSKLVADRALGSLFSRGDYYDHEGSLEVHASRLDDLVDRSVVPPPSFMKIDVQGMETEVFAGAVQALSTSLVAIRTEVGFYPIYENQPLFAEIDQSLRPFGFVPMRWIEFHEWRRQTRVKYPGTVMHHLPASRGQMMHGDVLYLLHPERLTGKTDEQILRLLRLALVALAFDHIDHAAAAFSRPEVERYIVGNIGVDPKEVLSVASKRFARVARHQERIDRIGRLISRLLRVSQSRP